MPAGKIRGKNRLFRNKNERIWDEHQRQNEQIWDEHQRKNELARVKAWTSYESLMHSKLYMVV